MNKIYTFLAIIILLSSCNSNKKSSQDEDTDTKPMLFVSIQPLKYFVDMIVKDRYEVRVMVPPGSSPETFSPSSKQMTELEKSDGFVKIGSLPFENRWDSLWQANHPQTDLINCSIGIPEQKLAHQHGDHVHYGTDPHIWLAPSAAKIIAQNIYDGILHFDPANKTFYKKNLESLMDTIDHVQNELNVKLENMKDRDFLIFHPVLGYLSAEYQMNQEAIEFEGKKPSLRQLKHIVEVAKKENITTILVQKEFSTSSADIIAKEIDGQVVIIDPLGYNWPEVMRNIGSAISEKE
ncbi:zinc ABC transporter substrate-binding protein [Halosquirtibacter laminarini]|uniref:Zinc ABC transporter substrate-binding protein n=1 Tax=Halosquirtibacter laminarini TaxID=3374600 RepID=A0AC61NEX3_9BACT|nr:zinc ABC transporter substrate-binding protein [Prolixibacteraceae bacterium]